MNPSIDPIPFARPMIGSDEEAAVLRVMRSGWLTTGDEASAFEREFAAFVGCRHALAVNSATAGLHLALEAHGIGPGDEVLLSPYTFASAAAVVRHLGARPVFVDVERDGFNIDPKALAETAAAHPTARAVMPVHFAGLPCQMDPIIEVARANQLVVIEDAAHAFPSRTAGGYAGTIGNTGVFSFYATKTITTGEGGMVCTDDDDIARRITMMRLHGIDRTVWDRYRTPGATWKYDVHEAGFKYNLPDILAAIGRVQLGRAEAFLEARKRIAARYRAAFSDADFLTLPPDGEGNAFHLFVVRLKLDSLTIGRDEFIASLAERGIGCSVHFIPLHVMRFYAETYGLSERQFPRALEAYRRAVSLPIYPGLDDDRIGRVIDAVRAVGAAHRRIR